MESYKIKHGNLCLELSLVDLENLHLHEEVIPKLVDRLAQSIVKDGVLRHPAMVDRESLVVLDGMHRVAALRRIGCHRMPVCLVDYSDPAIGIFGWYRMLKGTEVEKRAVESAREVGLTLKASTCDEGMKALETRTADALLVTREGCLQVIDSDGDVRLAFAVVKKLESQLVKSGLEVEYETASDAETRLRNGKADMILATPPIGKNDVINQGKRDEPFPPKMTRHTVPARPLEIDVPLALLRNGTLTSEEANRRFLEMLNSRKLQRIPPGSVIEGRRYDEEVYLFSST